MSQVIPIKGAARAPVAARSSMETLIVTPDIVNQWRVPPFQRPIRINDKVRALAKEIADSEVIPGVLTLGRLPTDPHHYVVDGLHRAEAFRQSGVLEALADCRVCTFADMGQMADAFVDLNTALVRMRPDDVLRGLEGTIPVLRKIREACPFVGYDHVRRGTYSPILSMSTAVRAWTASRNETPTHSSNGNSTRDMLMSIDDESAEHMVVFLRTAYDAWGKDAENNRLWSTLNLVMSMWLFRRLVLGQNVDTAKRTTKVNLAQFRQCLMALSADAAYSDWLVGRALTERDRSPCYKRIKDIFAARIQKDRGGDRPKLLQPAWVSN
jgi:hypothetical protein